jgi:hypothetical protein
MPVCGKPLAGTIGEHVHGFASVAHIVSQVSRPTVYSFNKIALLDASQLNELDAHLQEHLYDTAEAVARYVARRWGVRYTPAG